MNGADCFGHVPSSADERGQFSIFCDLSPKTVLSQNYLALAEDDFYIC